MNYLKSDTQYIAVTDIDIKFGTMVYLMVKWVFASFFATALLALCVMTFYLAALMLGVALPPLWDK